MFTDLEVIPLKGRLRSSALVLAAFAALIGSPVLAQSTKTGPRVMIPTLQSSDKELGVQAAEAIRSQLTKQTNLRDLVVVPKAWPLRAIPRRKHWLPAMRKRLRRWCALRSTSRVPSPGHPPDTRSIRGSSFPAT